MSPSTNVYGTGAVKRVRRTNAEMEALREAMFDIVAANEPCSVRSVYYMGIGKLWEKDQGASRASYKRVVEVLGDMREKELLLSLIHI